VSSKILLQYPFQEIYLLVAWLELATVFNLKVTRKIGSTDRQKLGHSSLKQFGGLTAAVIKNL
jgi:hypothetical protein